MANCQKRARGVLLMERSLSRYTSVRESDDKKINKRLRINAEHTRTM
ncbi:hypothetical protein DBT_0991 [Dissulfuribacter thermophilus]|uniref:Uncharacterized protein n=1 Tax=Dissulfuribacter thermophilus TaxID=1156395 RepID=A0A1B9F6W6_9BACT|nr:hypothetical protein DBT_0991 [Dissulfuribacter thermophilus]